MSITMDEVKEVMQEVGRRRGEWGGVPIPVSGVELVVEPSYPFQGLQGATLPREGEEDLAEARRVAELLADEMYKDWTVLNLWFCFRRDHYVYVLRRTDGKSVCKQVADRYPARYQHFFNSLTVAFEAHSAEAEIKALETLRTHIKPHLWDLYLLCGTFLETSQRSGITYFFRKGKPTLAMKKDPDGQMRPFVALCLHPIGFYLKSYAGVMCPTDDVIAHLLMIRADERKFWAKANQHPLWAVQSGI